MKLCEHMQQLGRLSACGLALIDFALSLQSQGKFILKSGLWVFYPANFVGFAVHYQRTRNIMISLYGHWTQFSDLKRTIAEQKILKTYPPLDVTDGRWRYTRATLTEPRQLTMATLYIEKAFDHYVADHGALRNVTTPAPPVAINSTI